MQANSEQATDIDYVTWLSPQELVDDYVIVCAEMRALKARQERLQQALDAQGTKVVQGSVNRVTIVQMPGAKSVDVKGMVADGLLAQSVVETYTRQGAPFKQYRVNV